MQTLTERQQQVLSFITSYIDNNGYPPSQREIAAYLGISGTPPVIKHLEALEKKGYLKRDSRSRSIAITAPSTDTVSLPVVGTVRAGHLTLAVEDIEGYMSVDRFNQHGGRFFLKVRGDSMINAAIRDGDYALVRPQETAENRDIVVAMVEGEATLKEFFREKGRIRLQPRNPNMEPIIIKEGSSDVTIIGKVVGIFRNMG